MNNFKKKAVAAAVGSALGLALTSAPAQAAPTYNGCSSSTSCTLADLFAGGSIGMGNGVVFGGFSFASSSGAQPFSSIIVTGDDSDPLNVGLIYSGFSIVGAGGFLDYSFEVDNTNPGAQSLTDATLSFALSTNATAEIFEDLFQADELTFIDGMHVFDTIDDDQFTDGVVYAPTDFVFVDLFLASDPSGWIDGYETYFSLDLDDQPPPNDVPEPGTLALLGAGLAGFGLTRKRKKKA